MDLGKFLLPEQHLEMPSALVMRTGVHDSSTQPVWNADVKFRANGDVRNLVSLEPSSLCSLFCDASSLIVVALMTPEAMCGP